MMRAVVLNGASLHVTDDWPEPRAGSGQVLVRVLGVGICGSDLALTSGHRRPPRLPWVPGHEAFGSVVAVGAGVPAARLGQRVVIEPNIPCLTCPSCLGGRTSACPDRVSLGFTAPGTLAELIAVPAAFAWEVPSSWSVQDCVCTEPLTVALAAMRRAGVSAGDRCLVIGAGSQGALLCVALVSGGIRPQVIEPHPGRRELAASLGAIAARGESDFIFETSGTAAALATAVDRAAAGAIITLIGLSSGPVPVDTETVVRRQLRIQGSLTYDHPGDFAATISSASAGPDRRPGRVLRACYPLERADEAFRAAREAPGKTWIRLEAPR
jgi:threonine dehydrogenase-like Zn-dependent dehydrogenase